MNLDSVRWAAATLLSRAFSLDMSPDEGVDDGVAGETEDGAVYLGGGSESLALVPWADLLRHGGARRLVVGCCAGM